MAKPRKSLKGNFFDNPVLEALTKSSPAIIIGMYVPLILAAVLYYILQLGKPVWLALALFGGAVFFWTFAEYILHRYVFHWVNDNKWVQRFHHFAHGFHHSHPRDKDHLFMPPLVSLVLSSAFFGLFYWLIGQHALAFTPGFIAGYLLYSYTHYCMHTITLPPKPLRPLWKHHHLHHGKYPNRAFGVSNTLWDRVFGTMPVVKK